MSIPFQAGERVRYIGRDKKAEGKPPIKGEIGTVKEVVDDGNRRGVRVLFDNNETLRRAEAVVYVHTSFEHYEPTAEAVVSISSAAREQTRKKLLEGGTRLICLAQSRVATAELELEAAREELGKAEAHYADIQTHLLETSAA